MNDFVCPRNIFLSQLLHARHHRSKYGLENSAAGLFPSSRVRGQRGAGRAHTVNSAGRVARMTQRSPGEGPGPCGRRGALRTAPRGACTLRRRTACSQRHAGLRKGLREGAQVGAGEDVGPREVQRGFLDREGPWASVSKEEG